MTNDAKKNETRRALNKACAVAFTRVIERLDDAEIDFVANALISLEKDFGALLGMIRSVTSHPMMHDRPKPKKRIDA